MISDAHAPVRASATASSVDEPANCTHMFIAAEAKLSSHSLTKVQHGHPVGSPHREHFDSSGPSTLLQRTGAGADLMPASVPTHAETDRCHA